MGSPTTKAPRVPRELPVQPPVPPNGFVLIHGGGSRRYDAVERWLSRVGRTRRTGRGPAHRGGARPRCGAGDGHPPSTSPAFVVGRAGIREPADGQEGRITCTQPGWLEALDVQDELHSTCRHSARRGRPDRGRGDPGARGHRRIRGDTGPGWATYPSNMLPSASVAMRDSTRSTQPRSPARKVTTASWAARRYAAGSAALPTTSVTSRGSTRGREPPGRARRARAPSGSGCAGLRAT